MFGIFFLFRNTSLSFIMSVDNNDVNIINNIVNLLINLFTTLDIPIKSHNENKYHIVNSDVKARWLFRRNLALEGLN